MRITRRLEFDAGHRIPNHQSQCRHLHGHRYALEITLGGGVIDAAGRPDDGMVMDFSEVKAIAKQHVVDVWDHAFLVWRGDDAVATFLGTLPGHKTVVLDAVPTAENLARIAFAILDPLYRDSYGNHLHLERIRLYETPNCWADATREDAHTINPRLLPEQIAWIANHAEDQVLCFDMTFLPAVEGIWKPHCTTVRQWVACDARELPADTGIPNLHWLRGLDRRRADHLHLAGASTSAPPRAVLHLGHHRQPQGCALQPPLDGAARLRRRAARRAEPVGARLHPAGGADVPRQRLGPALCLPP
jgi:6-pyruvoyltetrahydropterin/6-carboxytetrahydropterin synthase